ncbi:MAG: uroporphyrinogen-III synthase [Gammaproteobacteria bacterium]
MNNPPGVLVTRPIDQNQGLCEQLERIGCQPWVFPTLRIAPFSRAELADLAERLVQQPPPDWIIFVSANAVEHGWPLIHNQPEIGATSKFAAVGAATAKALEQRGARVSAVPTHQYDSDGLLALPAFAAPIDANLLIIRGRGGRDYLASQLRQRGAKVEYGECYRRELPADDNHRLPRWLADGAIDLVTVTSRAALENLFELCPTHLQPQLKKLSYVLISPTIETLARKLKITGTLLIADEITDAGICSAIQTHINPTQAHR